MLIKRIIFVFCLMFMLCMPAFGYSGNLVVAASPCEGLEKGKDIDGETWEKLGCGDTVYDEGTIVQRVLTLMYWIVGIVAVIMIIVSGIMYTTSGGDPARVKKAKDALTVAVIGLIIALLAAVIVNWVAGILIAT